MNSKYFKYIFIATIVLLIIAGIYIVYIKDIGQTDNKQQTKKQAEISKEIILGINEFDTLNPILTKSLEVEYITKLIYEPLINITIDFNVEPAIASEWSKLDDLTYIVKLDENKKWSNGEKVKVNDVQFTIDRIREADTIYRQNIEPIDKIEEIDETTFKIYLKKPVNFFEYLLCFPILEEKTYNSQVPASTSSYKVIDFSKDRIIVQGNDIKLIIKICKTTTELYNQFAKENVDVIITQNTDYETYIGNIGFEEKLIKGREFYYLSCENIKDKETRKTLAQIINREKLIYDLYNNKYQIADFPLEYGSYLNKENIAENSKTKLLSKTFTLSTSKDNRKIAEHIKDQLEEEGIKVNLLGYQSSKADLILEKETVQIVPDISRYFNNEQIKEQLEEIIQIENKEILKEEYTKIIDKYYEELPFISLYFNSYIILHSNKLKGDFSGNWYNIFYNINTWYAQ